LAKSSRVGIAEEREDTTQLRALALGVGVRPWRRLRFDRLLQELACLEVEYICQPHERRHAGEHRVALKAAVDLGWLPSYMAMSARGQVGEPGQATA
jgi:hypothetical protein